MCRKAFLTKDPSISSSKVTMSRRYKSQLITYRSPYITFFLLHLFIPINFQGAIYSIPFKIIIQSNYTC